MSDVHDPYAFALRALLIAQRIAGIREAQKLIEQSPSASLDDIYAMINERVTDMHAQRQTALAEAEKMW